MEQRIRRDTFRSVRLSCLSCDSMGISSVSPLSSPPPHEIPSSNLLVDDLVQSLGDGTRLVPRDPITLSQAAEFDTVSRDSSEIRFIRVTSGSSSTESESSLWNERVRV